MEETKKTIISYNKVCKECGKIIEGFNKKQVQWNYDIHIKSHKKKEK
jgi:hypothetical protein